MIGPGCTFPVLDEEKCACICGAEATTTRDIEGMTVSVCASCAAPIDAKFASGATPNEMAKRDADVRARWDAEQTKLQPGKRRTYDQASADDEEHTGRQLRRGRKRGIL